jgi:hypothetical protein
VDIRYQRRRLACPGASQHVPKLSEHAVDAGLVAVAKLQPPQVFPHLCPDCIASLICDGLVMERLHHLPKPERNEHANDYDADLASELAPAV